VEIRERDFAAASFIGHYRAENVSSGGKFERDLI